MPSSIFRQCRFADSIPQLANYWEGNATQRLCALTKNFEAFFGKLGPGYKEFINAGHDVYGDLRCGLAHEYYVKKRCVISMCIAEQGIGVRWNGEKYVFIVEQYFLDFREAFLRLESMLFGDET